MNEWDRSGYNLCIRHSHVQVDHSSCIVSIYSYLSVRVIRGVNGEFPPLCYSPQQTLREYTTVWEWRSHDVEMLPKCVYYSADSSPEGQGRRVRRTDCCVHKGDLFQQQVARQPIYEIHLCYSELWYAVFQLERFYHPCSMWSRSLLATE